MSDETKIMLLLIVASFIAVCCSGCVITGSAEYRPNPFTTARVEFLEVR